MPHWCFYWNSKHTFFIARFTLCRCCSIFSILFISFSFSFFFANYIIFIAFSKNEHCLTFLKNVVRVYVKDNAAWKVSVFGVFLFRIFPYSDWIQKDAPYLSVFIPNVGKHGSEKFRIWVLFTQCELYIGNNVSL